MTNPYLALLRNPLIRMSTQQMDHRLTVESKADFDPTPKANHTSDSTMKKKSAIST